MKFQCILALLLTTLCQAVTHVYDGVDRLVMSVHPNGEAVRYTYDDSDNITEIEPLTLPAAPGDLSVTRTDLTRATLQWTDNANNETGFRLMRRLSGDYNWQQVIVLNPNETTYTDVSLDPKENYVYRLVALTADSDLTSAYSSSATAAGAGSAAFDMSEPDLEGDRVAFSIETEMDELYIVEWSTTLTDESWAPVPFAKMPNDSAELQSMEGNDGRMSVYVDMPERERVFYRVTKQ